MDIYRYVFEPETLSLLFVFFTAFTVATLVPPVHRFLPRILQVGIWIGFVAVAVLRIAGVTDPQVREATAALVWAGAELVYMQAAALQGAVQRWVLDNRSTIATLTVVVAGVDVLALVLIRSFRSARRSSPRVHLGEWFVLPRRTAPAPDPLAEVDRRIATTIRARLHSLASSRPARAVFVKPFAHVATHLLRPGPARLRMVKLALGFEGHREQPLNVVAASTEAEVPAPAGPAVADEPSRRPQPTLPGAITRHAARLRHNRERRRWRGTKVVYIDRVVNAAPAEPAEAAPDRSAKPGEGKKDGAAAQPADRLAS